MAGHPSAYLRVLLVGLVLNLALGCAAHTKRVAMVKPAPATRPVLTGRPLMDISRGGAGLPLEDVQGVKSRDQLMHGLTSGLDKRLELPTDHQVVVAKGVDRKLDLLRIDVSKGKIRSTYNPKQFASPGNPEPAITVKKFEYLAWPIYYQNGETRWRLAATDVKFGLLKDRNGQQALIMTDAREGSFDFSVPLASIRPMLLKAGSGNGGAGSFVQDVDVQFTSGNPRSLTVGMDVKAVFLFVPLSVRLHARADLDQWCNVQFSELSCEGLDAGGKAVAALAQGQIDKYNGKVLPLVRWPGDRVVLSDVRVTVDDALRITAKFQARDSDGK